MAKEFYVYAHFKPDFTPFYIGKGHGVRSHAFYVGRNKFHKHIVNKYGKENIIVEVMPCKSENEAFLREQLAISALKKSGIQLANLTMGGEGPSGFKHSKESRLKMSLASKGRPSHNKGVPMSKEQIAKIVKANTGKKRSLESRKRMSEWQIGKIVSEETRKKMSIANIGKTLSPEHRLKISISEKNYYKKFWTHFCEVERAWLSVEKGCMCNWCNKKEK